MTLRTRLVLALLALSTVGLAIFGVTTASLYGRSQRDQLDEQIRGIEAPLTGMLVRAARADATGTGTGGFPAPGQGGFLPNPALESYAALLSPEGEVLAESTPLTTESRPDLPDDLTGGDAPRLLTTGSTEGGTEWRVLVVPVRADSPGAQILDPGSVTVVAVPTTALDQSMHRLIRIELGSAIVLLTLLGGGAWLILRAGLRPLEEMADSAETITAGDLSQRVEPADGRTEVGRLGLALNTMLDGLEVSFQEREATEQRLRQFLADASHELRTPLTSIQGFAELFRLDPQGDGVDLPVILRRIEDESARMRVLVEDLLLLARLDETRTQPPAPVDLTMLAADACTDAAATAPGRPLTLDAPGPVVISGIADHLRQAIGNLVTNAVRHTPDGTPIVVSVEVVGDRALVRVRDHGPGLDDDALAHVFDRFWQADAARVGTGAGLGLAIVSGIAEEHGGTASAANAPGGGAVFTLELPISRG